MMITRLKNNAKTDDTPKYTEYVYIYINMN
jgi:hypothetical protein